MSCIYACMYEWICVYMYASMYVGLCVGNYWSSLYHFNSSDSCRSILTIVVFALLCLLLVPLLHHLLLLFLLFLLFFFFFQLSRLFVFDVAFFIFLLRMLLVFQFLLFRLFNFLSTDLAFTRHTLTLSLIYPNLILFSSSSYSKLSFIYQYTYRPISSRFRP